MITVNGIDVQVVRKDIKNLHLAVYPPDGNVRVAVPTHVTDDNVRLAVVSKLSWIKRQQKDFQDQPRQSEREYVSGECHYYQGKRYRLELIEKDAKPAIELFKSGKLRMYVRPGASVATKERLLSGWYRTELKKSIPELLSKWQPIVGREAAFWGIKKMKTKWGSCNTDANRIWLNLELAKKPVECLEYILVHELVHLYERNHNERFKLRLEKALPNWRARQNLLNSSPLSHENWDY
ncbi:SprT family zinc-dependent metalloprotease [Arenicella sp. 4NH20-0111]|uniref:M48 family metallopeptidase n=1 Tax=Arenicella sp. 4NH20-0111 TaxID=3127648 RepID=UPI003340D3C3